MCEAKAVQTELTTISIGTNTTSVSFSSAPNAVLVFPEYRKTGTTDFTWSQSLELKNQHFVVYAQKYGKDWWNKEREKKSKIAKRLVEGAVFAKCTSVVHDFASARAWLQSVMFGDRLNSNTMSDGCRLEPGQLRGRDKKKRKSHSRLRRAKTHDDHSSSPCGAACHSIICCCEQFSAGGVHYGCVQRSVQ